MQHLPMGTITMLFTDIEGSTHLLEHLGERYTDVLAECRSLLRTVFHACCAATRSTRTEMPSSWLSHVLRTRCRQPWPHNTPLLHMTGRME